MLRAGPAGRCDVRQYCRRRSVQGIADFSI